MSGDGQLAEALEKSKRWLDRVGTLIDGVNVPSDDRSQVATALYHLCVEHGQGIHLLAVHQVYGSAVALQRPQMEAYVRGAWIKNCATEADIARFLRHKSPPNVDTLIGDLEKNAPAFADGSLGRMKTVTWDQLCSFTHGGSLQVMARVNAGEITQSYKPEHIAELLNLSAVYNLIGSVGISEIANSESLATKLRDSYQLVYDKSSGFS